MSPQQLGHLIDEHSPALVLFARAICDCPEDVVQDAFIELTAADPQPENTAAWLFRVTRNKAISAARSETRRKAHESKAAQHSDAWFESRTDEKLDAAAAAFAVGELPPQQREVVVLRLWAAMSFKEIGELTQTSDSTAQRRYVAALTTLREKLEKPCPSNEDSTPN